MEDLDLARRLVQAVPHLGKARHEALLDAGDRDVARDVIGEARHHVRIETARLERAERGVEPPRVVGRAAQHGAQCVADCPLVGNRRNLQRPGGILEVEAPLFQSKVMPVDPEGGKRTRVKKKIEDGQKQRVAKSGAVLAVAEK